MGKMVSLIIDSQPISVPQGSMVVDAAKQIGINIPVFCYHPKMEPVGMCRMCLVEIGRPVVDKTSGELQRDPDGGIKIQFGLKLETACTTPVTEGMVVHTTSEKVKEARRDVIEFLLTSHPLDCPVCDKGGECPLQNLAMEYGPDKSRFKYDEKMHLEKKVSLGELIFLDRERCIQCGRCVRFQHEIANEPVIGFSQRGRALEIKTKSEPGFDSIFSGNTTDICPVGALTTADFRFGSRPWELKTSSSICNHCAVGCNIVFNVRREVVSGGGITIKRVMPRQNELINEVWACDKARFVYHYAESQERLTEPLMKKDGQLVPATWEEALELIAGKVKSAGAGLVTLVGGRLSNEDYFNLIKLNQTCEGKSVLYSHMGGGDLVAKIGPGQGSNFADLGKGSVILVVASDLHEEAPIWWLRVKGAIRRGAVLIVVNPRFTELEKDARHVIRYVYGEEATTINAFLPVNHSEAAEDLRIAAQVFAKADNAIIIYGSEGLGLAGSNILAHACAELLINTEHVGRPNNGLLSAWPHGNTQGAWDIGFRPVDEQSLENVLENAKTVWIAGADPSKDDPNLRKALTAGPFVVVQELFLSETARLADVVLPVQTYMERDGTYTSAERRVQRFYQAIPPKQGTKPDYLVPALVAQLNGIEIEHVSASRVFQNIANEIEDYRDISYPALFNQVEQTPMVGRQDIYYGGTSFENRQGLGIQLTPAVQKMTIKLEESIVVNQEQVGPGEFRIVPVTRLYDQGTLMLHSPLLKARMAKPVLRVHPDTAREQNLEVNKIFQVNLKGETYNLEICLDDQVPSGIGILPRSVGIPLDSAQVVQCKLFEGS